MLQGISRLLTGDVLKILCDMGHGDELVIADANFPAETMARRLIRLPGVDGGQLLEALLPLFPLDTYVEAPACVMALTQSDQVKGMPEPEVWQVYRELTGVELGQIERFAFYGRARQAYAVIQTGEERQYGNLLLVKGVVKSS